MSADAADKVLAALRLHWQDSPLAHVLPVREHPHPHGGRRWRFDLAWPDSRCAVEVHGGVHTGGRHTRGVGYTGDREKTNAAVLLGWRVLELTTAQLFDERGDLRGSAVWLIEALLGVRDKYDALMRLEHERKAAKGDRRRVGPLFRKKAAKRSKASAGGTT